MTPFGTKPRLAARLLCRTGSFFAFDHDPLRWARVRRDGGRLPFWHKATPCGVPSLPDGVFLRFRPRPAPLGSCPTRRRTVTLLAQSHALRRAFFAGRGVSSLSATTRSAGLVSELDGGRFPFWHKATPCGAPSLPDGVILRFRPRPAPLGSCPTRRRAGSG
jgi:hypothetical protein